MCLFYHVLPYFTFNVRHVYQVFWISWERKVWDPNTNNRPAHVWPIYIHTASWIVNFSCMGLGLPSGHQTFWSMMFPWESHIYLNWISQPCLIGGIWRGSYPEFKKIVPFFVSYNYPHLIPQCIYEPSMKTISIPLYPNDPSIILHNSQENVLKILSSDIPFVLGSRQRHGGWRRQRVQDRGCACWCGNSHGSLIVLVIIWEWYMG